MQQVSRGDRRRWIPVVVIGLAAVLATACGADEVAEVAPAPVPPADAAPPGDAPEMPTDGMAPDMGAGFGDFSGGQVPLDLLPPLRSIDESVMEDMLSGPCAELLAFQAEVQITLAEADAYVITGNTQHFNWDDSVARLVRLYDNIPPSDVDADVDEVHREAVQRLELQRALSFVPTGSPTDQQTMESQLAAGGYDAAGFNAAWEQLNEQFMTSC